MNWCPSSHPSYTHVLVFPWSPVVLLHLLTDLIELFDHLAVGCEIPDGRAFMRAVDEHLAEQRSCGFHRILKIELAEQGVVGVCVHAERLYHRRRTTHEPGDSELTPHSLPLACMSSTSVTIAATHSSNTFSPSSVVEEPGSPQTPILTWLFMRLKGTTSSFCDS